ncbi:hypothetical protein GQ602_007395 [Ophiocordyceps camponoti-floridani]|uniref:Uncharacterized protein n=1 Tax=Ophiocordyceps camponoti-floridani TaxID=2030778 RepID=A0A8H4Q0D4_9HYPO|nr:hypothetical protein GQ602_007395 [Ophiocordyceps camponoti-floridani]
MAKGSRKKHQREETPDYGVDPATLRDETPRKKKGQKAVVNRALARSRPEAEPPAQTRPPKTSTTKAAAPVAAPGQKTTAKKSVATAKAAKPKDPAAPPPPPRPTVTAIPAKDRAELAAEGHSLFLSMPRGCGAKTQTQLLALRQLVASTAATRGLDRVIPSGASYLAVRYKSTFERDEAIKVLKRERVDAKDRLVTPVVAPFGVAAEEEEPQAWLLVPGPTDSTQDVADAVFEHLREVGLPAGGFHLRRVAYQGTPQAQIAVLWDKAPPFIKHLVIRGSRRLVSMEPKTLCKLCGGRHRVAACTTKGDWRLGRREDPEDRHVVGPGPFEPCQDPATAEEQPDAEMQEPAETQDEDPPADQAQPEDPPASDSDASRGRSGRSASPATPDKPVRDRSKRGHRGGESREGRKAQRERRKSRGVKEKGYP